MSADEREAEAYIYRDRGECGHCGEESRVDGEGLCPPCARAQQEYDDGECPTCGTPSPGSRECRGC